MVSGLGDSGWQSPFTESVPDDKAVRAKKVRNGLLVLLLIAAVAFAAGWNPPTKTVHKFTKASDYRPDRESGCTNSGKGCHGAEKTYSDFNAYHPNAKCTTCHDYQGVGCIPCHMPPETECQLCHDGTMKQAPDVVRLTDSYPRGHYRETTHTAMGTDMDERVRVALDGRANAKCRDCHSRDLRKSHTEVPAVAGSEYGVSVGCGECHNDIRSNGLAEVLSEWKKRGCNDCHKANSSAPQHGSDTASVIDAKSPLDCGATGIGCHDVNDLHALHKDKPKNCAGSAEDGEKTCHVIGAEAAKPNGITCGGTGDETCHRLYENGAYSHKRDSDVHSPTSAAPANNNSFWDTPCGSCHRMAADPTSLTDEHALATSELSDDPSNVCTNCHNNPASADAIADNWSARNSAGACSACHGIEGLPAAHEGNLTAKHEVTSAGCSDSGAGCHPTSDLMKVGAPTTTTNIHRDCLRCHDWTGADGNAAYDPAKKSCGSGRDCHSVFGAYDPASSVHDGEAGLVNGDDLDHHVAGTKQSDAVWNDKASGVKASCSSCHNMALQAEHNRPGGTLSAGAGTACARCHNADTISSELVKSSWAEKNSANACVACHTDGSKRAIHGSIETSHVATELAADGSKQTGACVRGGCHPTLDLRVLHETAGCLAKGCHSGNADILGSGITSCGGSDSTTACHAGYSGDSHFTAHSADLAGDVHGVHYGLSENVGCFGCHIADLRVEHENARQAGQLDGGGSSTCAICHAGVSGAGEYAGLPAVKRAIANHDMRCSACHASGSAHDGPDAVASPHKQISTETTLPAGMVWSDPAQDWKSAFDAVTGSGHNTMPQSLVGGAIEKLFPLTRFTIDGATFIWALPPNSGSTTWLKGPSIAPGSTDTTEAIQHIQVTCDDCHALPDGMNGPHGSSVPIAIDPEYSQTEYANPSRAESQFETTGTKRVVCFKCHPIFVGGVEGSAAPGGASLHARHVKHPDLAPTSKHYNGETCVDCHVRIPHAWKRPRMLIRTVETTDGAAPDVFPYVMPDHDGLLGIRLRSFEPQTQLRSGSCVTGGCHPASSPTRHPRPSDVPTATYWP